MSLDPMRCAHCGNRTRFDIHDTVRRRRFAHFTLGGEVTIEEEEILDTSAERIVCRWCDRDDGIERAPVDGAAAEAPVDGEPGPDRNR
jgi:hypothetical protein